MLSARDLFKIDTDLMVPAFSATDEHVPPVDPDYVFDRDTTLALLAGFLHNRRVMVQGRHGTGKSEPRRAGGRTPELAMRAREPRRARDAAWTSSARTPSSCATATRSPSSSPACCTWALQRPCALVFDEYDAGRADVMFVIQRVLEVEGRLTLLDQSQRDHGPTRRSACSRRPTPSASVMPRGSITARQPLNQGQMDRWNIVVTLNYMAHDREVDVVLARCPEYRNDRGPRAGERDGGAGQLDAARVRATATCPP